MLMVHYHQTRMNHEQSKHTVLIYLVVIKCGYCDISDITYYILYTFDSFVTRNDRQSLGMTMCPLGSGAHLKLQHLNNG